MLNELAPHSRVWIYQADRKLSDKEVEHIRKVMNEFISQWAAHGDELYGRFEVRENLFLIVGADEQKSPPSGCSIDTLMRKVQEIGEDLKVDFLNRLNIAVEKENGIELLNMAEFKALAQKDQVTGSTVVFNNLIENVGELSTGWKTTVKESWHKNLLEIL